MGRHLMRFPACGLASIRRQIIITGAIVPFSTRPIIQPAGAAGTSQLG